MGKIHLYFICLKKKKKEITLKLSIGLNRQIIMVTKTISIREMRGREREFVHKWQSFRCCALGSVRVLDSCPVCEFTGVCSPGSQVPSPIGHQRRRRTKLMQLNTQKLIFKSRGPEQSFNAVPIHGTLIFPWGPVYCVLIPPCRVHELRRWHGQDWIKWHLKGRGEGRG